MTSTNSTTVKLGSNQTITDSYGNTWGISPGGQVIQNGVIDQTTSYVIQLACVDGDIWQENAAGLWWENDQPRASHATWWPPGGTTYSPLLTNITLTQPNETYFIQDLVGDNTVIALTGDMIYGKGATQYNLGEGPTETDTVYGSKITFIGTTGNGSNATMIGNNNTYVGANVVFEGTSATNFLSNGNTAIAAGSSVGFDFWGGGNDVAVMGTSGGSITSMGNYSPGSQGTVTLTLAGQTLNIYGFDTMVFDIKGLSQAALNADVVNMKSVPTPEGHNVGISWLLTMGNTQIDFVLGEPMKPSAAQFHAVG